MRPFLDENGKEQVLIMGCYGIGVSRVVAASIEQNNDANGMIFPPSIAPFEVNILAMSTKDEKVMTMGREIHDWLEGQGIDTLFDDRDERPGVKFNEADLLGSPMQIVIGGKGLERGVLEAKNRKDWREARTARGGLAERRSGMAQGRDEGVGTGITCRRNEPD